MIRFLFFILIASFSINVLAKDCSSYKKRVPVGSIHIFDGSQYGYFENRKLAESYELLYGDGADCVELQETRAMYMIYSYYKIDDVPENYQLIVQTFLKSKF